MNVPDDPYFAGQPASKPGKPEKPIARREPPVLTWALVYFINAIVPFILGLMVTGGAGLVGMLLGLVLMLGAAYRLTAISREFEVAFEVGGWVVAVSQLFPVLQMLAGMIPDFRGRENNQLSDDCRGQR